ncbi:MAG: metalloregulator ArsR/SmtB family transcription factor [Alcanivorax sp.]|nr:metalloregulator ArsR/SmtB family transcription factor [Alcanivorax sp.]
MSGIESPALDQVFHALADPTRRAMLQRLAEGELRIGELAAPYAMSLAAASKHVRVLEQAGLVQRRVAGRTHVCRIEAQPLQQAQAWIQYYSRFWAGRLDTLAALLEADSNGEQPEGGGS